MDSQEEKKEEEQKEGEEVKENEDEKEEEKKEVIVMKKGDYNVHILIEELKNLNQVGDKLPCPVVKIQVLGKTVRTTKVKEVRECIINEHFYFDKQNMTVEMLDSEKIVFEVYDSRLTTKNNRKTYFGIFEYDFEYIYNRENHALQNHWVALANPESDDITKVNGYLKLSISVLHNKDPRVELEMKEGGDSCDLPPQVKAEYRQLSFFFFYAQGMPDMDGPSEQKTDRDCDGYIEVTYMGMTRSTKVAKMEARYGLSEVCIWNQIVDIPVVYPAVSQKVVITFKDDDEIGFDVVGTIEFEVDKIIKDGKYKDFYWANVYGSFANRKNKICDLMNYNQELGSRWKGRILMLIRSSVVNSPVSGVRDIKDFKGDDGQEGARMIWSVYGEGNNEYVGVLKQRIWNLKAKVISCDMVPDPKKSYAIKIVWGQKSQVYSPVVNKKGEKKPLNCWGGENIKSLQTEVCANDEEIDHLPEVMIYLQEGVDKKPLCFQRIPAKYFLNNYDIMIIKLLPEPYLYKKGDMKRSGLLKCKFCLYKENFDEEKFKKVNIGPEPVLPKEEEKKDEDEDENLENVDDWDNDEKKEAEIVYPKFTVCVVVYMSKDLIAAESNGTSDPFVQLECFGQTHKTSTKFATINGIWNEVLEFKEVKFLKDDRSTWPVFLLDVVDYNRMKDYPLGYSYIFLGATPEQHVSFNNYDKLVEPMWKQLYLPKSNRRQGKILLSFYCFDEEHTADVQKFINSKIYLPETERYTCEMNILGLRQLKPLSLFPVKKAYLKFDMNSLNVTGDPKKTLKDITTQPNSPGPNPTINSVIKFEVDLPKKDIFFPSFQCEVYDHILSGLSKNLLGVFALDLKKIKEQTEKEMDEDQGIGTGKIGRFLLGSGKQDGKKGGGFLGMALAGNLGGGEEKKEESKTSMGSAMFAGLSNSGSTNNVGGMSESNEEKKENDIKIDIGSESNVISTDSNLINNSNENQGFDKLVERKTLRPNSEIRKKPDDSEAFVQEARCKIYKIKGKNKQLKIKNPDGSETIETKQKEEYLVEDDAERPDNKYFERLGYFKNVKYENEDSKKVNQIIELDLEEASKDEKFRIQDVPQHPTIHYRRRYGLELEKVIKGGEDAAKKEDSDDESSSDEDNEKKLIGKPFMKIPIRRGKFQDKVSETGLSDALSNINGKILTRYNIDGEFTSRVPVNKKLLKKSTKGAGFDMSARLTQFARQEEGFEEGDIGAGNFKGLIKIAKKEKMDAYLEKVKKLKAEESVLLNDFKHYNRLEAIRQKILVKKELLVRVYILKMKGLASCDVIGESDPYVKLLLGDKVIKNDEDNYQDDAKDCDWYKYYDFNCTLPGPSTLTIEVWDKDILVSDDLIGSTQIDLEDRYFDTQWQALKHKPIETRELKHPDINGNRGYITLWLEMFDLNEECVNNKLPWNITPEPSIPVQIRLVIWDTEDMEMMDVEGTSDVYIKVKYGKQEQTTDIHFRCQTGIASFNWRIVFDAEITPQNMNEKLLISAYDKDLFASDDFICSGSIPIKELLMTPKLTGMPAALNRDYYDSLTNDEKKYFSGPEGRDIMFEDDPDDPNKIKFWLQGYKDKRENNKIVLDENHNAVKEPNGRIRCSLDILPKDLADLNPVGKGRKDPNTDPFLPPPTGRISFTLNPFKMINQCVGPKYRRKVYCWCCCILLIVYLGVMMPTIFPNFIANLF